jgi:hypothetical protein
MQPHEIERMLDRVLLRVEKPGRYVGGEYNSVAKDWDDIDVKVALAFPDIYDLGMSNLGIMLLYDQVNQRPDMLAERVFSPWRDMEAIMRTHDIPLYSLETKHRIRDFDLLGISIPYEQLYTNVLNLLDLAGMPVRSEDRDESYPLVIAGGIRANPEPMADFIDFLRRGRGHRGRGALSADAGAVAQTDRELVRCRDLRPTFYDVLSRRRDDCRSQPNTRMRRAVQRMCRCCRSRSRASWCRISTRCITAPLSRSCADARGDAGSAMPG